MRIVLDENVPLVVAARLRELGHEVCSFREEEQGITDERVWRAVTETSSLLVMRNHHFTNPLRFDPRLTLGIIYLRRGNLRVADEVRLIEAFLQSHGPEEYAARLVTLSPGKLSIR